MVIHFKSGPECKHSIMAEKWIKVRFFCKPILIDLKFWNSQYFFLSFQESIKKGSEVWPRFAAHLLVLNNQNCGLLGDYINHLEAISITIFILFVPFLWE